MMLTFFFATLLLLAALVILVYMLAKIITRGVLRARDEHEQELIRKYHEGLNKPIQTKSLYRKDE